MFNHYVFRVHDILLEVQSECSQPNYRCQAICNLELISHVLGSRTILKLLYEKIKTNLNRENTQEGELIGFEFFFFQIQQIQAKKVQI